MATVKISDTLKLRLSVFAKRRGRSAESVAEEAIAAHLRSAPEGTEDRLSLAKFAASVQEAANSSAEGQRFGDNKVFISEVARNLQIPRGDLRAFKRRLLQAREAGLLGLARADLVEAMDPRQVDDSETVDDFGYGSEQYHFVRIPR